MQTFFFRKFMRKFLGFFSFFLITNFLAVSILFPANVLSVDASTIPVTSTLHTATNTNEPDSSGKPADSSAGSATNSSSHNSDNPGQPVNSTVNSTSDNFNSSNHSTDSISDNSNSSSQLSGSSTNTGFQSAAPNAILMEATTGTILYEKDADKEKPPASVTKIMTLLLIFEALAKKQITLNDTVTVSEHAASMGGSQVFLEPGETQTVDTMIKCIAVSSANDACVAMAEHISGSEDAFVAKMNEKAQTLGMKHTHFINCCGLDADGHYTSARDIAFMSRELITNYPNIFHYTTIWMENITHVTKRGESEFGLSNTNKLLRQYQGATGLKTGSTSKARFCLSATAKRNHISLIAVVMACQSAKERVKDCAALLDYGFSLCKIYTDKQPPALSPIAVHNSTKEAIPCKYEKNFSHVFTSEINQKKIQKKIKFQKNLSAPIKKNQAIGKLEYYYGAQKIGGVSILAASGAPKAKYVDYLKKLLLTI